METKQIYKMIVHLVKKAKWEIKNGLYKDYTLDELLKELKGENNEIFSDNNGGDGECRTAHAGGN